MRMTFMLAGLLSCSGPASAPLPMRTPSSLPPAPVVAAPPSSTAPASVPVPRWPTQPGASWPSGCVVHQVAMHPSQPWLAVACGLDVTTEEERGAVVVIDVDTARVRSVTPIDAMVCAFDDPLLWHPDGTRLAVNVRTNHIVILERGRPILEATPDEGRDHGMEMLWLDDRLLVDLGGYLGADGLEPIAGALSMSRMVFNPDTQAVVGFNGRQLRSYAPATGRVRYDVDVGQNASRYACGPRGRRCTVMLTEPRSENGRRLQPRNRLRMLDGGDGKVVTELEGSLPQLGSVTWAPDGRLAVRSYDYRRLQRGWGVVADHVDIVTGDRVSATVDLGADRMVKGTSSLPTARRMAFTQDGRRLAIMVEGGGLVVADARSGRVLRRFAAPSAPVPEWMRTHPRWESSRRESIRAGGLVASQNRLVRLYKHGLSIWSLDGERRGQWTAAR